MPSAKKTQRSRSTRTNSPNPLTILGYLNFSGGEPSPDFRRELNGAACKFGVDWTPVAIRRWLETELSKAKKTAAGFADATQAVQVIRLVFDDCVPAYRRHHADLLFHLEECDFYQAFFLAMVFEAVLQQGGPWSETPRIVAGRSITSTIFWAIVRWRFWKTAGRWSLIRTNASARRLCIFKTRASRAGGIRH